MQGSAGPHSPLLNEHDKVHVPVWLNENQTELPPESVIELHLDEENGQENQNAVESSHSSNVPDDILIEMPVPLEENVSCDLQQLIGQTENEEPILD